MAQFLNLNYCYKFQVEIIPACMPQACKPAGRAETVGIHSCKKLKMNTEVIDQIKQSYVNKKLIVFVGAGISLPEPAGIPHAIGLKNMIFKSIARNLDGSELALERVERIGLENLISIINLHNPGFIKNFMKLITRCETPRWTHKAAKLISQNSGIAITTNFDCLLENSFVIGHDDYEVLHNNTQFEAFEGPNSTIQLVKLHGCSLKTDDEELGITLQAIGNAIISKGTESILKKLGEYDILFLGYRGRDIDIMLPLSSGKGKVFWCWHKSDLNFELLKGTDDNPVVKSFCYQKDSKVFKINTDAFLETLIEKLDLQSPNKELNRNPLSFEEELQTILQMELPIKAQIWSRVMFHLGFYEHSISISSKWENKVFGSSKLDLLFLKAECYKYMNNKNSFDSCKKVLGEIEYEIKTQPRRESRDLNFLKKSRIQSYILMYNKKLDEAISLLKNSLDFYKKNYKDSDNPDFIDSYLGLRMELGNCFYYLSRELGDNYNRNVKNACNEYIKSFILSLNNSNILTQAKLLENIAHTYNKWIFELSKIDSTQIEKLRYGILSRNLALFYLEFIGNDSALGRTNLNIGYDYSRTRSYKKSFISSNRRLTQSISNNDYFGIAISLELMADSMLNSDREMSLELYNSAKQAFLKSSDNPTSDISNIDEKIEKGFTSFDWNKLDEFYSENPSIGELLEWMKVEQEL